jgi:hypothetical protein
VADDLQSVALAAARLPPNEMTELEASVAAGPSNREARARLLGCYQMLQFHDAQVRDRRVEHVVWFIEHTPEDEFTGTPWCGMDGHAPKLPIVVAAWEHTLAEHPQSAMVIYNAARFFTLVDPARTTALLERGEQLEPAWMTWPHHLGTNAMRRVKVARMLEGSGRVARETPEQLLAFAREALGHFERALRLKTSVGERMSTEQHAAEAALACDDLDTAARHAHASIDLAPSCPDERHLPDWLHFAHVVLGHAALARGDRVAALAALTAAGARGSDRAPVLRSFGPDFRLARSLLELGERDAVLAYLTQCATFWDRPRIATWLAAIERGEMPLMNTGFDPTEDRQRGN